MTVAQDLPSSRYTNGSTSAHTNDTHANGNGIHKPPVKVLDGFGTRAIHVGSEPSEETGAVIPAISLSTTYRQEGVGNHKGYEYSRSGNPNRNALERTLAAIEAGGSEAIAFSSGSSTTATIIQSLGPSAHVISVNDVYGGTFRYITRVASTTQGVTATFLDLEDISPGSKGEANLVAALQEHPNTKLVWVETPTNPTLRVIDIARLSEILDTHFSTQRSDRPLLLVDNTFASPFYTSPLLLGADIVLHSLTKYVNGHSDVVMGALILPPKHTALTERLRFLQNASGAVPSPYDCWLAQRGAKTLHLRMKQHGLNALKVVKALRNEKGVEQVIYPGYGNEETKRKVWRNLSPHAKKWIEDNGLVDSETGAFPFSGMVSFRLRAPTSDATYEEHAQHTSEFLQNLRLFSLAESLGGVESLAEVPARMTHASIPPKEREQLGIGEGLVRLSVGIEEAEDLVEDLKRGLDAVFSS
ncbi:cystathionine gamma-lyase [Moniliophthora roreri]|uniref:cystathionine gamma-lyase n=1 Tax=Moniliophthora roreri TaxID=221103 RepID=A0A0W0G6L1_MONRR|nr:cystathionine gamma-lyase [Moniliophthora roreri]